MNSLMHFFSGPRGSSQSAPEVDAVAALFNGLDPSVVSEFSLQVGKVIDLVSRHNAAHASSNVSTSDSLPITYRVGCKKLIQKYESKRQRLTARSSNSQLAERVKNITVKIRALQNLKHLMNQASMIENAVIFKRADINADAEALNAISEKSNTPRMRDAVNMLVDLYCPK